MYNSIIFTYILLETHYHFQCRGNWVFVVVQTRERYNGENDHVLVN